MKSVKSEDFQTDINSTTENIKEDVVNDPSEDGENSFDDDNIVGEENSEEITFEEIKPEETESDLENSERILNSENEFVIKNLTPEQAMKFFSD